MPYQEIVDFEEINCNVIKPNKLLNPNDLKAAEIISKMLEESDKEPEEDKNFHLYLSDNEELEDLLPNDNLPKEETLTHTICSRRNRKTTRITNYKKYFNS